MAVRRFALGMVVGAVVLVAVSCGEDDGEGSTAVSKAEFVRRANAVCRRERAGVEKEASTFLQGRKAAGVPLQVRYADTAHFVLLPVVEHQIERIRGLEMPPSEEKRVDAMLFAETFAVDEVALSKRMASIEAVEQHFAESARLLRAYGLFACANGPGFKRWLG